MARGRPDWTFHFTPAPASWTDAVEGFFSRLTGQRLKDSVFDSLDGCVAAMEGYTGRHNASDARPFRWSRNPDDLVASWKRGHRRLQKMAAAANPAWNMDSFVLHEPLALNSFRTSLA